MVPAVGSEVGVSYITSPNLLRDMILRRQALGLQALLGAMPQKPIYLSLRRSRNSCACGLYMCGNESTHGSFQFQPPELFDKLSIQWATLTKLNGGLDNMFDSFAQI